MTRGTPPRISAPAWTSALAVPKCIITHTVPPCRVFSEIHRVLKPDGMFISLTFGQPHFRKPFMMRANYDWDCRHWAFGDFGQYFVYALKRGSVDAPRSDMPFGAASTLKVTPRVKGAEDSDDGEEEKDFLLTMGDL